MNTGRLIVLWLVLLLGLPSSVWAEDPATLVWAFFLKDDGGQVRSLPFDQPEIFVAGDLLRLYLQLQENTYVYIYLYDSRKDLYLVFPPSADFYADEFPAWRKFYIPSERGWFTLDRSQGIERFYLLASNHRLVELEGLTDQYLLDEGDPGLRESLLQTIERQVELLGESADLDQIPVPVPYAGSKLVPNEPPFGSLANLTRADENFSLVLDLVNR